MLLAALLLAPVSADARKGRPLRPGPGTANPSALIAADMAMSRRAADKGLAKALRDYAADDAAIVSAGSRVPVPLRDWLARPDDSMAGMSWNADRVWMSCDGSLGVTSGNWRRADGAAGTFTKVWEQPKPGQYRWRFDLETSGAAVKSPAEQGGIATLDAVVADCAGAKSGGAAGGSTADGAGGQGGVSADGTLAWAYRAALDGTPAIALSLRRAGAMKAENIQAAPVSGLVKPADGEG